MDIVGRYGGDEFVVGIVEASELASRPIAERIHRHMAKLPVPDVTVSIGLAGLRGNDSLDSLLARADAAMYRAKAKGRGQIALSGAG
jgi:diguanylate cyclase (GGDEF)-like protein